MFGNETIISLFFRFANFAVLVVCASIIFKKYILPIIVELLKEQQDEYERLTHHKTDLEVEHTLVAQELENDKVLCQKLKEHVDVWRQKSDELIAQREQERQAMMIALYKKMEQREKVRENERVQAYIAQKMTQELSESLTHHFEKEDVGLQYVNSVIAHVEKDIS